MNIKIIKTRLIEWPVYQIASLHSQVLSGTTQAKAGNLSVKANYAYWTVEWACPFVWRRMMMIMVTPGEQEVE